MALPHSPITPIPSNEPDATPSLWNTRYSEIDQNFENHENRLTQAEEEIADARGGKGSLGQRLSELASNIDITTVEMQNALLAAVKFSIDQAALANYSVRALREQIQQEGVVLIKNRGIVGGCAVTKSSTAARNLTLAKGTCFANGRSYSVTEAINATSVPSNASTGAVTVYAYLYQQSAGGTWRLAVTQIGSSVPDSGILIYSLTIPAGNTDATDPNLSAVTVTDSRRIEPQYPIVVDNPAMVSPILQSLRTSDYGISFDLISAVGAPCGTDSLVVISRATNGFTVALASSADNVVFRWKVSKLNN